MSASLGEKLRRAREERGISISEVAEQTRISPLYLKSIENDDYKPLPGGIFNKGFVRSYARYIGFDENEALQDYAQLMAENELSTDVDQHIHHSEVWTDDRSARSMAPTVIFAVVILALLGGGIVLLVRYLSGPSEPRSATANTPTTASGNANSDSTVSLPAPITPAAAFTVELKAVNERVWVGYTLDGAKTEKTLDPGQAVRLDVQESLRLGFAKVKAQSLELAINGKRINVLGGGPKGNFDFDVNKTNVSQIVQSGELGTAPPVERPVTPVTPRPSPRPTLSPVASPRPPTANANVGRWPPQ
jgi:transcriptional regulator with XRE-family HTH domain